MGIIRININKVEDKSLLYLDKAYDFIQEARKVSFDLSKYLPASFIKKKEADNMFNDLASLASDIYNYKKLINNKITIIKNAETNAWNVLNEINEIIKCIRGTEYLESKSFCTTKIVVQDDSDVCLSPGRFFKKVFGNIDDIFLMNVSKYDIAFVRTGASIKNFALSIGKGIIKFGEGLFDAALAVVGVVATFTSYNSIYSDCTAPSYIPKSLEETKEANKLASDAVETIWGDGVAPIIANDFTSNVMNRLGFEDYAYEPFLEDGSACKTAESVSYYTAMILLATVTGGVSAGSATTAAGKAAVNTATSIYMGVASFGEDAQTRFNDAMDEAALEGRDINSEEILDVVGKSVGRGVIDGGTFYVASNVGGKVSKPKKEAIEKVGNIIKGEEKAKKVFEVAGKSANIGIKSSKGFTSEFYDSRVDNRDFNTKKAVIDSASILVSEAGNEIFGKLSGKSGGKTSEAVSDSQKGVKIDTDVANAPGARELSNSSNTPVKDKIVSKEIVGDIFNKGKGKTRKTIIKNNFKEIVEEFKDD